MVEPETGVLGLEMDGLDSVGRERELMGLVLSRESSAIRNERGELGVWMEGGQEILLRFGGPSLFFFVDFTYLGSWKSWSSFGGTPSRSLSQLRMRCRGYIYSM